MDTPGSIFGILVLAVGLFATAAYGMIAVDHKTARRCFYATAVFLAAIGIELGIVTSWPLSLKIIVAGAFAFAAAGGLVYILNSAPFGPSNKTGKESQGGGLYLECTIAPKPIKMPADGRIAIFYPHPIPLANGGGGFAESFMPPGSDFVLPGTAIDTYKCQITNYEEKAVFTVDFNLQLRFAEVIKQDGGGLQSGATALERPWLIRIGKIDPGTANSFTLYMHNNNADRFVFVSLPSDGMAQRLGEDGQRSIRITTNVRYPIGLSPHQEPKQPEPKKN